MCGAVFEIFIFGWYLAIFGNLFCDFDPREQNFEPEGVGEVHGQNKSLSVSESLGYVLSGTFYRIEKAFTRVILWRHEVGTYREIL